MTLPNQNSSALLATDRPLTIAHIFAPAPFGGLERVVTSLANALVDAGDRVILIAVLGPTQVIPGWLSSMSATGLTLEILRVGSRSYLQERRMVSSLLRNYQVDIVHTHGYRADLVHGGVARAMKVPTVSTVHGFTRVGIRGRTYEWLQRRALRRFDAIIAVSRALAESLYESGIGRKRIVEIANSLALPPTKPAPRAAAREALGLATEGPPVIGWVGRLSHEKGPDIVINAFALLRDSNTRLCLVGDGPLRPHCEALVARLGLDERVHFAGVIENASHVLGAFDILALSSRSEGTPMILLEAATSAVPIVASAVGGVPDLLGQDGGLLVDTLEPQAFSDALGTALRCSSEATDRAVRLERRLTDPSLASAWVASHRALYRRLTTNSFH